MTPYDSRTPEDIKNSIANIKKLMAEKAKDIPLEAGNYILTRDVTNPYPDKRKKYDWRDHAVWKSGTEFVVTEQRADFEFEGEKIPAITREITLRSKSSYRLDVRRPAAADDTNALKLQVLIGSLQKVQAERLGDIFVGEANIYREETPILLAILLEDGKVSMPDIRAAMKKMYDMEDYKEIKERNGL